MEKDKESETKGPETPEKIRKTGKKQISTNDLPRKTIEECLGVAKPIHEIYAGKSATWDELASAMGVGAKSPGTKYLIWGAQAYELVRKDGDKYYLSETGRKILAPNFPEEKTEAILKAVRIPTLLSKFYSDYNGKLIPDDEFLDNLLENRYGIPRNRVSEAKEVILENATFAGILMSHANDKKTIRLEGTPQPEDSASEKIDNSVKDYSEVTEDSEVVDNGISPIEGDSVCFYITPIGDEGSEQRKHSDMLLKHLVEPAFKEFNISIVRADKIGKSGLISQQVFEYIVSSKFCVADLSFGNPNAFYELGVRHMTKLPTIQIIRKGDKIPFDVAQGRTIVVDVSDIYTVLDRIESAKKELVEHIRNYITPSDPGKAEDNPVSIYLPGLQVKLPK